MIDQFLENWIASFATPLLVISYIAQLWNTYKTKNVEGISLSFWILISTALTCLLINSIYIFITQGTWGYMVTEIFNAGLAYTMLFMVIKYRKRSDKKENQ